MSLLDGPEPVLADRPTAAGLPAPGLPAPEESSIGRRSPLALGTRRYLRNWLAVIGGVVLIAVLLTAFALPLVMHLDPYAIDLRHTRQPPGHGHLLGTDGTGRDVFARLVYGGRISIGVGLAAAALAIIIGAALGSIAGTFGGWIDMMIMRTADIFLSFPSIVVVIVLAGIFGPSVWMLIVALGVFVWPTTGRVVRGVVITVREREFVQAARAVGAGRGWLITRHLLPAALSQIVVIFTLTVANCILQEAALSFLGLGVQPPRPSWGNMLTSAQGVTVISSMPWLWLPPGIAVALIVLCVNFVGDGLRDAVDPRQQSGRQS
ncbi:MAG TPA: ABC transporter permease [Jatrophihabitantaceae bacterium]|jgi:peptide/nickel transport system permease protein